MRSRLSLTLVVVVGILPLVTEQARGENDLTEDLALTLTSIGCIVPPVTAGTLTLTGNEQQRETGHRTLSALLAITLLTKGLKEMIDSPRPGNPNSHDGFPSGHASISFAFARVITAEHNQWELPAYLWATGVSWSRLERNQHTFGQVAAGAALGWCIADWSIASNGGILGRLFAKGAGPVKLHSTAWPQTPGMTFWAHEW